MAILEALKHNHTLKKLDLQGQEVDSSVALALCDMIRMNNSLSELILELDQLSPQDAHLVAKALRFNISLTDFHVGNKEKLPKDAVASIAATLKLNKVIQRLLSDSALKETVCHALILIS
jgi:hypothetical protein